MTQPRTRADRMMDVALGRANRKMWHEMRAHVPPEQEKELMRLYRLDLGPNAHAATRAGLTRQALLEFWERRSPEPDAPIEGYAIEVGLRREIGGGL